MLSWPGRTLGSKATRIGGPNTDAELPSVHPFHAQPNFSPCQSPSLCPQVEFPPVMAPAGLAAPMASSLCSRWLYKRQQINLLLSFLPPTAPCSSNSGRDLGRKELPFSCFHPVLFLVSRSQSAPAPCGIMKDAHDSQWQLWSGP